MIDIAMGGIGSPFGDDQVGWQVIEYIFDDPRSRDEEGEDLFFIEMLNRPQLNLCHFFEHASHIYLIDAMKSDRPVGSIIQLNADEIMQNSSLLSTHGFGVSNAIKLAKSIGLLPKNLMLYGIEIGPEQPKGETLSPVIDAAAKQLAMQLMDEVLVLS